MSASFFKSSMFAVVALAAISMTAATPATAVVYNLNADWSDTDNPNGPWTLRGDDIVLPYQTGIVNLGLPGQGAWAPSPDGGNFLPSWFKAISSPPLLDWLIGDVVVHTPDLANGATYADANVLFTAPTSGVADISGSLWNARNTSDRPQGWELLINGLAQDSGALADVLRSSPTTFSVLDVVLNAGDTVMLRIFRTNISGTSTGDFVGTNLTIDLTPVPVPPALPLFASGLAMLGLLGWRRKRKAQAAA